MPDCPVDAPSQITIPPANEPGERVIVTGRVFGPDGTTPLPHASIYVYHTDARGYYAANGHVTPPRLHGCLRSDDLGRYEIHTIKPGSYPGMRIPSHIHYKVRALGFREDADEIQFAGDPFLKKGDYDQQANDGTFSRIRPLQKDDDGVQHCVRDFKLQRR